MFSYITAMEVGGMVGCQGVAVLRVAAQGQGAPGGNLSRRLHEGAVPPALHPAGLGTARPHATNRSASGTRSALCVACARCPSARAPQSASLWGGTMSGRTTGELGRGLSRRAGASA